MQIYTSMKDEDWFAILELLKINLCVHQFPLEDLSLL